MNEPLLALTTGEPAGIGPDLALMRAVEDPFPAGRAPVRVVAIGDPELLAARARQLGLAVAIEPLEAQASVPAPRRGVLPVWPVALRAPVTCTSAAPSSIAMAAPCAR